MFTGIIEKCGHVVSVQKKGRQAILALRSPWSLSSIRIGESISVDGCCLTVAKKSGAHLFFDLSSETLKRTTLGQCKPGLIVNLERALRYGSRMGGHFVLGHVDGVGRIRQIIRQKKGFILEITYPSSLHRYLIQKGSISVDGISLTINNLTIRNFNVFIVPHTLKKTNLGAKKRGDRINLEADVLGKYLDRLILPGRKW